MKPLQLFFLFLFASVVTSCVSYRKYEDTLSAKENLNTKVNLQADSLQRLRTEYLQASEGKLSMEQRNALLREELNSTKDQYIQLDRANKDLLTRYDRVLAQNQAEISASSNELTRLRQELSKKELALAKQESELNSLSKTLDDREADLNRRIANLEANLNSTKTAVAMAENELDAKTSEVNQLRSALAAKDAKINALRDRIKAALIGFNASDLSVEDRGGKVYVSLSQNLLFASGSKTVNANGMSALSQVARALKDNDDIAVMVEGHTDTDGTTELNWDLSTGRATAVAKQLIKGGIDPKRITAAGRGQFQPISDNTTAEGKAANRRTEIILTPKLGELYELVVGSEN